MPVTINGTTGITTPDLASTADISANSVPFGAGGGNVATNVAAGDGALNSNTTATRNVGIGYQAGFNNTTGQFNVLIGNQAGYRAAGVGSIGDASVFVGYTAGYSNQGNNNIGVGNGALYSNTTGTFNVGVGVGAGYAITTGTKNTIVGSYTGNQGGLDIRTSNNNVVLSDGDGNPRVHIPGSGNMSLMGGALISNTLYTSSGVSGTSPTLFLPQRSMGFIQVFGIGAATERMSMYQFVNCGPTSISASIALMQSSGFNLNFTVTATGTLGGFTFSWTSTSGNSAAVYVVTTYIGGTY